MRKEAEEEDEEEEKDDIYSKKKRAGDLGGIEQKGLKLACAHP